jgi:peptidoglycan/LPS O-acetylase OafA/YrhL
LSDPISRDFRCDIQGLRAIAIVAVLAYHFDFGIAGGFVGVDIFFVISGYLITRIIANLLDTGQFNFWDFCIRRARRILPALIVVAALTYAVGLLLLSPLDLINLSQSVIAASTGWSNALFYLQSGYFDLESHSKPLLHTWSLAVELQFYLVWPLLLVIMHRLLGNNGSSNFRPACVSVLAAASFVAAVMVMAQSVSAAFYLTPFRGWEFAVGGLVALNRLTIGSRVAEMLGAAGLTVSLAAIVLYSARTPFPGIAALLPCAGAVLTILAGPNTVVGRLLGSGPSVWIGERSYSIYLVHWPLLILFIFAAHRSPSITEAMGLVVATIVLAAFSYRYVETQFRSHLRVGGRALAQLLVASLLVVTVPATLSWLQRGWGWRMPGALAKLNDFDVQAMNSFVWARFSKSGQTAYDPADPRPRLLLVGDSQAADLLNVMHPAGLDRRFNIATRQIVTECGLPFIGAAWMTDYWKTNTLMLDRPDARPICVTQLAKLQTDIVLAQADIVAIAFEWRQFAMPYVADSLAGLRAAAPNARLIVYGTKSLLKSTTQMANERGTIDGLEFYALAQIAPYSLTTRETLSRILNVTFVDMLGMICDQERGCLVITPSISPIYFDHTHFSPAGADFVASRLGDQLFAPIAGPRSQLSAAERLFDVQMYR